MRENTTTLCLCCGEEVETCEIISLTHDGCCYEACDTECANLLLHYINVGIGAMEDN